MSVEISPEVSSKKVHQVNCKLSDKEIIEIQDFINGSNVDMSAGKALRSAGSSSSAPSRKTA